MSPNEERERKRMDMQHEMFLRTFDRKLLLAPYKKELRFALDLGTGTGNFSLTTHFSKKIFRSYSQVNGQLISPINIAKHQYSGLIY